MSVSRRQIGVMHKRAEQRPLPLLATMLFVLALVVGGCGGSPNDTSERSTAGAGGSSQPSKDPITVGTDPSHPPHDFLDKNGKTVGWEYEFMQAIGQQMGRPVEYKSAAFAALLPGLQSGRYDLVFANLGVTKERLAIVDMATVFKSGQAFLGNADSDLNLSTLDTLCGQTLGTTQGSTQADLAQQESDKCVASGSKAIDIKLFPTGEQIILAVESGRVDVYWTAQPIAQYYATQPGARLKIVGKVPGTTNPTAIAFPKDSPLTEEVHTAVQALIDDGTYLKILKKWQLEENAITTSEVNPEPSN